MTAKKGKSDEEAVSVEDLEAQLADAKEKADQYLDMARRLQADFDNYRKRTERDKEEQRKMACSSIVKDLLNVVDDLDRAIACAGQDTSVLLEGVKGVRSNLMKVLEENGLQEIPAEGKFDPDYHEALCVTEGDEDDMIADVLQKGYTLNGKVVRFAKVRVTKKAEPQAAEEAPEVPAEEKSEE